ncbi:MAG TPA: EF-P lysine aminoacylase GenX, partial [Rhodobacteraceae bacterium]|nr:EF-P lysine aminoacylase GenX [Paracoccaceae bacterium]
STGQPAYRLSVGDAFLTHAGIDLTASCRADGPPDREALASAARAGGYRVADDDDWSDLFSRILVQSVEPVLGMGRPTILYDYPIHEAALARPCPHDARLAERFELYACGVELANGFGELTDADTQRARFEAAMMERRRRYGANSVYPLDEDFLAALQDMPPASGCALGFDRLVMLAVGAPHIEDVIWTPHP